MKIKPTAVDAAIFGTGIVLKLALPNSYAEDVEHFIGCFKADNEYELKQVRIYLKEAMPLYSNGEISSPDSAIRVMSEALAGIHGSDPDHFRKHHRWNDGGIQRIWPNERTGP